MPCSTCCEAFFLARILFACWNVWFDPRGKTELDLRTIGPIGRASIRTDTFRWYCHEPCASLAPGTGVGAVWSAVVADRWLRAAGVCGVVRDVSPQLHPFWRAARYGCNAAHCPVYRRVGEVAVACRVGGCGVAIGSAPAFGGCLGRRRGLVQWARAQLAGSGVAQAFYRRLRTRAALVGGVVVGAGCRPMGHGCGSGPLAGVAASPRLAAAGTAGAVEPELLHGAPAGHDWAADGGSLDIEGLVGRGPLWGLQP